jgi:hypothetical protein
MEDTGRTYWGIGNRLHTSAAIRQILVTVPICRALDGLTEEHTLRFYLRIKRG